MGGDEWGRHGGVDGELDGKGRQAVRMRIVKCVELGSAEGRGEVGGGEGRHSVRMRIVKFCGVVVVVVVVLVVVVVVVVVVMVVDEGRVGDD